MNLKKYDDTRDVYVPSDQDVWYILEYEKLAGSVIMTYYNQNLPLTSQKPIHKLIKRTYTGSVIDIVFSKCLNNFQIKREEYSKEYEPVRTFTKPTGRGASWDLTDVSNNMKPMPQDFRNFMFTVSGRNSRLTERSWVTKADIDQKNLDTQAMNSYLASLDNFELHDKKAGWPKI